PRVRGGARWERRRASCRIRAFPTRFHRAKMRRRSRSGGTMRGSVNFGRRHPLPAVAIATVALALVGGTAFASALRPGAPASRLIWANRFDKAVDTGGLVVASPDGSRVYQVGATKKLGDSTKSVLVLAHDAASGDVSWS